MLSFLCVAQRDLGFFSRLVLLRVNTSLTHDAVFRGTKDIFVCYWVLECHFYNKLGRPPPIQIIERLNMAHKKTPKNTHEIRE